MCECVSVSVYVKGGTRVYVIVCIYVCVYVGICIPVCDGELLLLLLFLFMLLLKVFI